MTGKELDERLSYLGMQRNIRKLALDSNLLNLEKLALMNIVEVCDVIVEHYEVVFFEREKLGLVKKENMDKYYELVEFIER